MPEVMTVTSLVQTPNREGKFHKSSASGRQPLSQLLRGRLGRGGLLLATFLGGFGRGGVVHNDVLWRAACAGSSGNGLSAELGLGLRGELFEIVAELAAVL